MSDLTLYAESSWMSPWVFHVLVALEEKQLPYKVEVLRTPIAAEKKAELQAHGTTGKVPLLVHQMEDGKQLWLAESLAISEYLAERFPAPKNPRLFPPDLADRARARQIMSMLRTSMLAIREERPTSSVWGRPLTTPLSDKARREADDLIRLVEATLAPSGPSLFGAWCIADADLSLALMRLIANQDPMPQRLVDYALAQWDRASVKKFSTYLPTMS